MGEERLIEIALEISKLDGPLWTMGYLETLNDSEMYLFLKYVGSSKYRSLNVYDAICAFSHDYLISKGILTDSSFIDSFNNMEKNKKVQSFDDVFFYSQVLTGEQTVNQGKGSRR